MPHSHSLAIFAVGNEQGRSLADAVKAEGDQLGFDARVIHGGGQEELARACVFDDFVVFDASVEDVDNYGAAVEVTKALPYVFIVSRTYLPINFQGVESGGAPDYPGSLSNDEILDWLKARLREAADKPPRSKSSSFNFSAALSLTREMPGIQPSDVFISYRGALLNEVKMFADQVVSPKTFKIFQPAPRSFHQTALTAFDRWAVLAVISDSVIASREVCVYDSGDELEYLKSWWTIGELFVCAYRGRTLKRYEPATGKLGAPLPEHVICLAERHKARMSKLFTNSHPAMMGPESVERIQNSWFLRLFPYYNDIVFTKTFTDYYLLECDRCIDWKRLLEPDVFLNVEGFYKGIIPGFSAVNLGELNVGLVSCVSCEQSYKVVPKSPYLLWIPAAPFSGRPARVQKRPMFEIEEFNK